MRLGETGIMNMDIQISTSVLGLARIDITFFVAALGVVCSEFVAKIVDNTPAFWLLLRSACSVTVF